MSYPFNYQRVHRCEATVLMCIDFRFHEMIFNFIRQDLRVSDFDVISMPGASKNLAASSESDSFRTSLGYLETSIRFHESEKIILVNHSDCGAYGGRTTFGTAEEERLTHISDLKKSGGVLKMKYPRKEIIPVYANLSEKLDEINFEIVH